VARYGNRNQKVAEFGIQLVQGRKLATVLRTLVREYYGNRSEKVAEFGLQPLRTRSQNAPINPLPQPE
jgi:hypothetical protein